MNRPKTIICDIDETILKHSGSLKNIHASTPKVLENVLDTFVEWDNKGYNIILITGRRESLRKITEEHLAKCGIFYDQLVMGVGGGSRVLINDLKPNEEDPNNPTAIAINIKRDAGLKDVKI